MYFSSMFSIPKNAQEVLRNGQMAGAGDGQEFRHALDNPH